MATDLATGDAVRWYTYENGWRFGRIRAILCNYFGEGQDAVSINDGYSLTTRSALGVEKCGDVWPKGHPFAKGE